MFRKIHIWIAGCCIALGAMSLTAGLMQGLRLDSVATLVVLACGWVGLVWLLKSLWTPVLLFAVCLPAGLGIPLPFLWKIELFALLLITITGIEMWEVLTRGGGSGRPVFGRHWPILLAIALFVGRAIVDMPGSAQMGGRGGLSIAVSYVAGMLAFPLGLWVGWRSTTGRRGVWMVCCFALFAHIVYVFLGSMMLQSRGDSEFFLLGWIYRGYLFQAPAWLVMACILGLSVGGSQFYRLLNLLVFTVVSVLGTSVAIVSVHRAFPIFAVTMSWMTVWAHQKVRYMIPLVAALGVALAVVLGLYARGVYLPEYLRRPMSVFSGKQLEGRGGEYGWENDFRARRADEFLATVKEHVWVGRGFSFSAVDMERELLTAGHFALIQSYHNSFFTIISAAGVPLGLSFLVLVGWLSMKAVLWTRKLEVGDTKTMATVLMTFLIVSLMQAGVQGGGMLLGRCLLVLGILHSLMDRSWQESVNPNDESACAHKEKQ